MNIFKIITFLLLLFAINWSSANEIIVTSTANNGAGSFRQAVSGAMPNDTIIINVKGTINLTTQIYFLQSNITVIGPYPKHNTFTPNGAFDMFNFNAVNNIKFVGLGFVGSTFRVIRLTNSDNIEFESCLFENNTTSGSGSVIYASSSSFNIINCSFIDNIASQGGAIYLASGTTGVPYQIVNSTFYNNIANGAVGNGGAIYFGGAMDVDLINNLFHSNSAPSGLGQALYSVTNTANVNLYNNVYYLNGTASSIQIEGANSYADNGGNVLVENYFGEPNPMTFISLYPPGTDLFLRTTFLEDGYGLKYFTIINGSSVLINTGSSAFVTLPPTDCRRAPRELTDGISAFNLQVDAGPSEYTPFRVVNTNPTGPGSFFDVLSTANSWTSSNTKYIEFDIGSYNSSVPIDLPSSNTLNQSIYIDGYSQNTTSIAGPDVNGGTGVTPAYNLVQLTTTNGVNSGITVGTSNCLITGLNIHGFNQYGISTFSSVTGIEIYGNHIGFSGNAIGSYIVSENKRCGIALGANNSKIGGNQHWQRNVISGNGQTGLTTFNSNIFMYNSIDQVDIVGNIIGLQADGNSAFAFGTQTQNGIHCWAENMQGNSIKIGNKNFGGKNIISGNRNQGIYFSEMGIGNTINNNIIGLGYDGVTILGNGQNGIKLISNLNQLSIGDTKGNIISGNTQNGIDIYNCQTTQIQNNFIGTDITGTIGKSNFNGIVVGGSASLDNIIGLDTTTANVISGNSNHGISVIEGDGTWILGNLIGTNANGTGSIGNSVAGVNCESAINTKIGGIQLERNIISGNGNSTTNGGIILSSTGNTFIAANYIGTDITGTSAMPNRQGIITLNTHYANIGAASPNYNVISGNIYDGIEIYSKNTTVNGNIIGLNFDMTNPLSNSDNGIDVEVDSVKIGAVEINVVGGNSNNGIYLNNVNACEIDRCFIGTDPTTFSVGLGNQGSGIYVLNGQNNNVGLVASNTIVDHVNTGSAGVTVDAGVGTKINNNLIGIVSNGNTIANDIGIQLINGANNNLIGNVLSLDKNVISGNTSSGILIEGSATTNNAVRGNFIGVGIDGVVSAPNNIGISITNGASSNWIGEDGFVVKRNIISANTMAGILLNGATTSNNVIYKNYIGCDSTNTVGASNNFGVWIKDCSASNYVGSDNNVKNSPVISGNQVGIVIDNSSTQFVFNSKIGVRNLGTIALPNTHGIVIQNGSFDNVIGGSNPYQSNIISGNDSIGIAINNCNTNSILGNRIGSNTSGSGALGNNLIGVFVNGGNGNVVGTSAPGEGNLITSNGEIGLILDGNPSATQIMGNFIGVDSGAVSVFPLISNSVGLFIKNTTNVNVVGGSNAGEGNYFASNAYQIAIENSSDQSIEGNVIGINKVGTSYLGNQFTGNGVYIKNSSNISVGNTTAGSKNKIGNQENGIYIDNSTNCNVQNNYLGNDLTGNSVLGGTISQAIGVKIDSSSTNNQIGPDNVISGNDVGVKILNAGTSNNNVQNNFIGVTVSGNVLLPNNKGIEIVSGATNNIIGGTYASDKNVISGNTNVAINILDAGTSNNIVAGNIIGLGIDETTLIGNNSGIAIFNNASLNVIGGANTDSSNYICDNNLGGVFIGSSANDNIIKGNKIGVKPDNVTASGNQASGIIIDAANGNIIGGLNSTDQNEIANNIGDGVEIKNSGTNNQIIGNSIYNNGGLAIDINNDGVTVNNASGIQNNVQMPIILQAFDCNGSNSVDIALQLRNLTSGNNYLIEFYDNSSTPDGTGYGEADAFIQRFNYVAVNTIDTAIFTIGNYAASTEISASITALSGGGGTSEMSQNYGIINQPSAPSISTTNETCQGANDGSITISDLAAMQALYFGLNADVPQFNPTFDSVFTVLPGTYTVTSKYLNGCTVTSGSQIISTGGVATFSTTVVDDTCGLGGEYTMLQSNSVGTSPNYIQVGSPDINLTGGAQSALSPGVYQVYMTTSSAGVICISDSTSITINAIDLAATGNMDFVMNDFCSNGTGVVATLPNNQNGNYQFNPMPGDGAQIVAATGEISNATQGSSYTVEYFYGTCTYTQTPTAINAFDPSFNYSATNTYCFGIDIFPAPTTTGGTYSFVNPPGDGATIDLSTGLISNETQGGVYDVEYNTGGGCPGIDTITVTILTLPAPPQISTTDSIYCDLGEAVAPLTTNLGVNVEWYDGPDLANNLLTVEPSYTISLSSLTSGQNTYYYATVTDGSGCQSFPDSIGILLADGSTVNVSPDVEICLGSDVELNATGGLIYQWMFDDNPTDSSIIVTPQIETIYIVNITDTYGCLITDSVKVSFLPASECNIEIYTAFSPNGDGNNDTWIIDGIEGYKVNIVYFYNRWGDLVNKIENYDNVQNVWDGKNQFTGQNVANGTYYYIVEAGDSQARNGWVQVVK